MTLRLCYSPLRAALLGWICCGIIEISCQATGLEVGDIIIAQQSGLILKVNPETGAQTELFSNGKYLAGIKLSLDNQSLYVTDATIHGLRRLDLATGKATLLTTEEHLLDPQSVAIDRNGDAIVTSFLSDKVVRVNRSTGKQSVLADGGLLSEPLGTCWYRPGKLLVGNYGSGSLVLLDTDSGNVTPFVPAKMFKNPYYLEIDTNGVIYVGNHGPLGGNKIQRYDPQEKWLTTISEGELLVSPLCAVLEEDQRLIVANHLGHSILRVDPADGLQTSVSARGLIQHTRAIDIVRNPNSSSLVFTPTGGFFKGSVKVDVITRTDGVLHYTLDGSEPTTESPVYSGPFTFTKSAAIKGRLFSGKTPLTGVVTAEFQRDP